MKYKINGKLLENAYLEIMGDRRSFEKMKGG